MIKRRNVDPSFINWIQNNTGIGPGIGAIKYLVPDSSATSQYRTFLRDMGVGYGDMFTSLAAGYAALTEDRNDVLLAFPGTYTSTASLAWDKSQTHLIGVGGPNQRYCPTTPTEGAIMLNCSTANVASIIDVTGHHVQIQGIQTQNTANDADNVCDIKVRGKNLFLKHCHLRGGNGAAQLAADAGIPLYVDGSSASYSANGLLAEDCIFGTSGNDKRTAGPGAVMFKGSASSCFNPVFRRCTFEMRCETSGSANPQLIDVEQAAVDRMLLFDNCVFYAFWENLAGKMDYAIVDGCTTTHMIVLRQSTMAGIDFWCNVATYCFTDIAEATDQGGEVFAVKVS
jgi:hypothetical protein